MAKSESRDSQIVRVSFVGIIANVLLAAAKLVVGIATQSIAFVLDAVNSLTDAFASVVTIFGAKLAAMKPSRNHPFGYGRIEYITSIVIAAIVLAAGIASMRESIVKIIHPSEPTYTIVALVVMSVTALAKVALGLYFKRRGRAINAGPLIASGIDSLYDSLLTAGTVVSAIICMVSHVDIDGWVGAVISVFIIKAGVEILGDAVNTIIGTRPSEKLAHDLKALATSHQDVLGAYDLFLDSFGPETFIGSVHIEVLDDMDAKRIHEITRDISERALSEYGCLLTVGIYATNNTGNYAPIREKLLNEVKKHPEVLEMHGFYVDAQEKSVDFDLVFDFRVDDQAVIDEIVDVMTKEYPDYRFNVVADTDFSE